MARTTKDAVKEIINTSLGDPTIEAIIDSANILVTNVLSDSDLGATTLAEIERWLTAHMISISWERQATDEKLGEASIKYAGVFGEGLKSTTYGQMVLMMDTSGLMRNAGKRSASIKAIESFDD
jgi:hypothetical protein